MLRFAISDGASESLLAGPWANILTRAYCRSESLDPGFEAFYARALTSWQKWKLAYLEYRKRKDNPIRWYEEPGLDNGAFATLLGLRIEELSGGRWHAIGIGDSCLFHVRNERLITHFPIKDSASFNNSPRLLASKASHMEGLESEDMVIEGTWLFKDRFYLATDALSQWFLKEYENGNEPWTMVDDIASSRSSAFEEWINRLRNQKQIKNDDVTLLEIRIG